MVKKETKQCPRCGSDDVLPYESDERSKDGDSFIIIILSALLLIVGYFVVVLSSYLYFPAVVLIAIVLTARITNRQDRQRKKAPVVEGEKDYLCLSCDNHFKLSEPL